MRHHFAAALAVALLSSVSGASTLWLGTSGDVSDPANWDAGVPNTTTNSVEAIIVTRPNAPDIAGGTVSWLKTRFNGATDIADTGGGGQLNLTDPGIGLFSAGSHSSTVNVPLNVTGRIQTNGDHDVTFNAPVTANKIESFATAVGTYNAPLTMANPFMTIGAQGEVVINDVLNWTHPGEKGLNGADGTLVFGAGSTVSLGILNLFDNSTVRAAGNNVVTGATDLWARTDANFDLDGFSQALEFLGTNGGRTMTIDFGDTPGGNDLVWDSSVHANGFYDVENFEAGVDRLEFGQFGPGAGFMDTVLLSRITINGAPYAESNPMNGGLWWTTIPTPDPGDNPNRQIAVLAPEPGAAAVLGVGLLVGNAARRRRMAA
ncbi:MAG: hypothetical protein AAGJ46_10800 [Planctomycetota bacterium]